MNEIKPALLMLTLFTLLCGGIYPAAITGLARLLFPHQAGGSLITDRTGTIVGSTLIGQPFSDPQYLWPRPSATGDFPYNPLASGGSNAGPTNPSYLKQVEARVQHLRTSGVQGLIPAELVQASASGLDPHISPDAASVQIHRIAEHRGMSEKQVSRVIAAHTDSPQFGFLGMPRVNVLAVNLELDTIIP